MLSSYHSDLADQLQFGKTIYHQGDLSYYEAVNKETLANSLQRFVEEGILLVARSRDPKIPTTIKLAPKWTPERDEQGRIKAEGKLWEFTEKMLACIEDLRALR